MYIMKCKKGDSSLNKNVGKKENLRESTVVNPRLKKEIEEDPSLTLRVREASEAEAEGVPWWAGEEEEDRQSATALRSGSGGFLSEEDLNLDAPLTPPPPPATVPPKGNREVAGVRDGL